MKMGSGNPKKKNPKPNRGNRPPDEHRSESSPQVSPTPLPAESDTPPTPTCEKAACEKKRDWLDYVKFSAEIIGLIVLIFYTTFAALQWCANEKAASAAKSAADTAAKSMEIGNRPWVKIKHRVISPLKFDIGGRMGSPLALMKVEDTIENVGQSVALNVLSWEDVIPMDIGVPSTITARNHQAQWCDANRHPDPHGLSGYILFPHDPLVEQSEVGPQMATIEKFTIRTPRKEESRINGMVAFVLVGCVCYRSSFESKDAPTHQTRFMYYLGRPEPEGGFFPYVLPRGTADELRLILIPDSLTAD